MEEIKKQMEQMESNILGQQNILQQSFGEAMKDLGAWRDKIDGDISSLKAVQESMQQRLSSVEESLVNSNDVNKEQLMQEVRVEMQEQRQKIIRLCNLVLMGVPESNEGIQKAEELLKLIVPNWVGPLTNIRIGEAAGKHPRPIRVTLSTVQQKNATMKNRSMLKDRPDFKTISVRNDLTKKEQGEWKEHAKQRLEAKGRMTTRSEAKRKREDDLDTTQSKSRKEEEDNVDME